jgi:hypothetical protein
VAGSIWTAMPEFFRVVPVIWWKSLFAKTNLEAMIRTADEGRRLRAKLAGLRRAAYWRRLGFPNCELARAALARKRAMAKHLCETEGLPRGVSSSFPLLTKNRGL